MAIWGLKIAKNQKKSKILGKNEKFVPTTKRTLLDFLKVCQLFSFKKYLNRVRLVAQTHPGPKRVLTDIKTAQKWQKKPFQPLRPPGA